MLVPIVRGATRNGLELCLKPNSKVLIQHKLNVPINRYASTSSSHHKGVGETSNTFAPHDTFVHRHIGPRENEISDMLSILGLTSRDELIDKVIPNSIRLREFNIGPMRGESEVIDELKEIALKNNWEIKSFIGNGFYNTLVPNVILRNVLENPAWYTPYTPYQAEISQGRLESLLNFQTMITDITGLDIANASLLDESSAAAEAMTVAFSHGKKKKTSFFVSSGLHPQNIAVIQTRAKPLDINVVIGNHNEVENFDDFFGAIVQYPNSDGTVEDYTQFVSKVHEVGALAICATDLLALTVLKDPGSLGFDIALGNSQRFGVPPGFGGPHAAFMSARDPFKRILPGRIIGISRDSHGDTAYRMALQTREQHIKRERATSNICTAQALLSNMAAFYAIYHGPNGLKHIAVQVHNKTRYLYAGLKQLEYKVSDKPFFDTIRIDTQKDTDGILTHLEKNGYNVRRFDDSTITLTLDETTTEKDVTNLLNGFASFYKKTAPSLSSIDIQKEPSPATNFERTTPYLTHPVFNMYHSETEMLRYMYRLQLKDIGLTTSMIPLGSCTMKLNATAEMLPVTWPQLSSIHPFVPKSQTKGWDKIFKDLERFLSEITGFPAVSLQPNAGSQGEYAGLMVIREYYKKKGESHRHICLIPVSAHGTNPASAIMAGFQVVAVDCDNLGNVDVNDLKQKAERHRENLAALMITYPSTHGVYEEEIKNICSIIHANGGQVYMDGANMNAQVGFCSPANIGADVCHLNLHKTFCIPHGGGGPGMGPIGVAAHLADFLPTHPVAPSNDHPDAMGPVASAPFGSAAILTIPWVYIQLMGTEGLKRATQMAILNANYILKRLEPHYPILFRGSKGFVAHEFIIDLRGFKKIGLEAEDVAKRLMDYGFHAPTLSFPIANTLMIEPTESESKAELDRFVEAMISIRNEIRDVETGKVNIQDSVLRGAPHTQQVVIANEWNKLYTREQAAFPVPHLRKNKFWPTVGRIDNVYGDRNLFCTCPPMEEL